MRGAHLGVFVPAPGEHVLEDGLFFLEQPAGIDQVLARGEDLRIGARHLDGGERAFVHLRPGIGVELFGQGGGLLLHLLVFVERHEIGIETDHPVDRCDELLLEQQAHDSAFISGNADEAAVEGHSETAPQRLCHRQSEARGGKRSVSVG